MAELSATVRIYLRALRVQDKLLQAWQAVHCGIWLGFLNEQEMAEVDQYYYDRQRMYRNEEYNRSGLQNWEKDTIEQHFQGCRRVVVGSSGGGREVLALERLGFAADGFECNPTLVGYANELLASEGCSARVELAPRNECPAWPQQYDGAIVGWGSYMLVPSKAQRLELLRQYRRLMKDGGPILLSFFPRKGNARRFRLAAWIANILRTLRRQPKVEVGDDLAPNFVHHCSREEIQEALEATGFRMESFQIENYGWAVGVALPAAQVQSENLAALCKTSS